MSAVPEYLFFEPEEPPEPASPSLHRKAPQPKPSQADEPAWPLPYSPEPAAVNYARLRARWAQNKHELAQKLDERDLPRIIAMLRYFDAHLTPGEETSLRWPLHREKSRAISQPWKRGFKTAARILHLKSKRARDKRGKPIVRLYLARNRDVWSFVCSHLGFIERQPPRGSTESDLESPFLSWAELKSGHRQPLDEKLNSDPAARRIEREQFEREIDFTCVLAREDTELKFRSLPAGSKLTKKSEELAREFADELGPTILLQRIKAYLSEDYEYLGLPPRERLERLKPAEKPPQPKEPPTVKEFVQDFKNQIRYR